MRTIFTALFVLFLCVPTGAKSSQIGWFLKVNPEETIGVVLHFLSGDALDWHKDVELTEFYLSAVPTVFERGVRLILTSTGLVKYQYADSLSHEKACMHVEAYPVEAYEYRFFEQCG